MANEKLSAYKKAYLVLRWPITLGILGLAGVLFFVGLINSIGYNGTTELRAAKKDSLEWKTFTDSFEKTAQPTSGKPFKWKIEEPRENGNLINFDKRLIGAFDYLKDGSVTKSPACGWSASHELVNIDVDNTGEFSSYGVPPNKSVPQSTVYRGVGARVFELDYIKCVQYPKDPSAPEKCVEAPTPRKFPESSKGFPIPLSSNDFLTPEVGFDEANCRVTCAVDYYPAPYPDPTETNPPTYNKAITDLAKFDPKTKVFEYSEINQMGRKASFLKSLLLSYELMHIDDKGCQSPSGSRGSARLIPNTLILQGWVFSELGDDWKKLEDMAKQKFPFNYQLASKLAGLARDPVLNVLGVHFNY